MKLKAIIAAGLLYVPSAQAGDYVAKYLLSQLNVPEPARKAINACMLEKELPMCKQMGTIKRAVNKGTDIVVNKAKDTANDAVRYIGMEKPFAATVYVAKVVIDKKLVINRIKLPIINNDSGSLKISDKEGIITVGWSF